MKSDQTDGGTPAGHRATTIHQRHTRRLNTDSALIGTVADAHGANVVAAGGQSSVVRSHRHINGVRGNTGAKIIDFIPVESIRSRINKTRAAITLYASRERRTKIA